MGARLGPLLSSRPPTPAGCWLASGRRPRHCPRVAARGLRGALSRGGLEDGAAFCVVPARPGQWGGRCRAGPEGWWRGCFLFCSCPPAPRANGRGGGCGTRCRAVGWGMARRSVLFPPGRASGVGAVAPGLRDGGGAAFCFVPARPPPERMAGAGAAERAVAPGVGGWRGAAFCVVPARPGQWGGRCRAGCWGMARRCVLCFSRPPTPEGCWLATRHQPRHCPRVAARGLRGALSRGGLGMARRCVLWFARPPALDGLRARGAAAGVMIFMLGHHALGQAFARGETTEGGERDLLQLGVRHGDVRLGQDRSDAFQLLPV